MQSCLRVPQYKNTLYRSKKNHNGRLVSILVRAERSAASSGKTMQRKRPKYVPGSIDDPNYVRIFDTTLRDGEQSPGATLTSREKLEIAKQLSKLGASIFLSFSLFFSVSLFLSLCEMIKSSSGYLNQGDHIDLQCLLFLGIFSVA